MVDKKELAHAFVDMYEQIDGVSDEMTKRDHALVNMYWNTYLAAKKYLEQTT